MTSIDTATHPKISVITPSFNQANYLERTIRSVLDQNYSNLEYIILDGGSTDGSVEIIKRYDDRLAFWQSAPDRGQSDAINQGFKRSSGILLGWLNSDDYLLPGALESFARLYVENPHAGVYVGGGKFVDEMERVQSVKFPATDMSLESLLNWLDDFHFIQPSCFFTRQAWCSCGPLDEGLHFAMDLDLWLKFAARFSFARTDSILSCSRIHQSAKTTEYANQSIVDSCLVLARHGGEQQARKHLEWLAARLTWNEYYVGKITQSLLFKILRSPIRFLMKSEKKWEQTLPSWHPNRNK